MTPEQEWAYVCSIRRGQQIMNITTLVFAFVGVVGMLVAAVLR
jgi:hypothetical protein